MDETIGAASPVKLDGTVPPPRRRDPAVVSRSTSGSVEEDLFQVLHPGIDNSGLDAYAEGKSCVAFIAIKILTGLVIWCLEQFRSST